MAIKEPVVTSQLPKPLPAGKTSFEEFLDWLDEDVRAEWVDGEVTIMTTPASLQHQTAVLFLVQLLSEYAEARDAGTVVAAPFMVRLPTRPSGREPDLLFVTKEHESRLTETYLDGPPDVVVEVVSPDSLARDRGEKFAEYEAAGVPEYWLIDPVRREADFYVLTERSVYRSPSLDAQGRFHSRALPAFWLKPDWLWQRPLPSLARCLGEILG